MSKSIWNARILSFLRIRFYVNHWGLHFL